MGTPSSSRGAAGTRRRSGVLVVALCWLVVVFDGYDLIVYGTTIPALLEEPGWDLGPGGAGNIGSLAFAGMLVGALLAGNLADRLGRRRTILACVVWFTLFSGLCGFAPGAGSFAVLRFLAGLGLGGLVPSANALAAEFLPARFRSVGATAMMSGVPIGGSIAALAGIPTLANLGWQWLYFFSFAGFVLVAVLAARLPESPAWLRGRDRVPEAERVEVRYGLPPAPPSDRTYRPSLGSVLRRPLLAPTVLFGLATVATLFAWYGLGTWLPKLTASEPRFDLGSDALTYLLALNLGAAAGSSLTAWAATRFGPLRCGMVAAACAAAGPIFLTTYPQSVTVVYAALIVAGIGTHGTQCLIIAAIADRYPGLLRGTALGFALGAGRIGAVIAPTAGGWLLDWGYGVSSNFLLFGGASVLSAALLAALYLEHRRQPAPEPVREAFPS